ncbi:MAG: hypothetical protein J7L16_00295 [Deltaproteobacteria bacterium]|nr:hypothetical protein [Deltaproteobacteria bacterium]
MKKRKNYTKDFKARVALDAIKGRKTINELGGCPRMPFFLNSALCSKNYPRNINYMSAVIF